VVIGSYNTSYSRRQLWIQAAAFSVVLIGAVVCSLTVWPLFKPLPMVVLAIMTLLVVVPQILALPWRIELTAAEFRWHSALRTRAVPLSQVQTVRRTSRNSVYVKLAGRLMWLQIVARADGLGTFGDDIKAAAPHVTVLPPDL
jgi:hypothetical protein